MAMLQNCITLTNTLNGDEYLAYTLKSIYDFPRLIVVIDGTYSDQIAKETGSPYSTDNTQKIVEEFPDPEKKIIYERVSSSTQKEQRSRGLVYLEPDDWLFIVDDDEVYKKEDLERLAAFLTSGDAKKDNYRVGSHTFINSFEWKRYITDPRIFRAKPGMAFIGSNNLTWDNGNQKYKGFLTIPDVIRFHYSYVRNNRRLDIRKLQCAVKYPYKKHGRFFSREDLFPVKFEGEHPAIMRDHPYAKIKWHPRDSKMGMGPIAKPILQEKEKKEVMKWEEFYKPFHREDYLRHIEAWKGICHIIARHTPPKGRILEIGFGTGMMSIYLSKMGDKYNFYCVGFDKEKKMVDRAKNLTLEVGGRAKFACHDLFDLDSGGKVGPSKVGTYHTVFSQGMLEHFNDDQIRKAIEIMFKIGRKVCFSVPIEKFAHKSRGDERLLSDAFWRRIIAKYELLHFSKFAKDTQIIAVIRRREVKTF